MAHFRCHFDMMLGLQSVNGSMKMIYGDIPAVDQFHGIELIEGVRALLRLAIIE